MDRNTIYSIDDVTEELDSYMQNAFSLTEEPQTTGGIPKAGDVTSLFHGYNIELEARLNYRDSQEYCWNRLQTHMRRKGLQEDQQEMLTTNFGSYSVRVRETQKTGGERYIYAEEKIADNKCTKDYCYWIKYHLSLEKTIYKHVLYQEKTKKSIIKKVASDIITHVNFVESKAVRYSYNLTKDIRLDLTRRESGNMVGYQIEVELANPSSDLRTFVRYCREVSRIAKNTTFLYSYSELCTLCSLVNFNLQPNTVPSNIAAGYHINRSIFNEVSILTDYNVRNGSEHSLVGGDVTYCVCHKTDGMRSILVISDYGIWFIYPPRSYDLMLPDSYKFVQSSELTIYDGELLRRDVGDPYTYQVFDCLYSNGVDVRRYNLGERMASGRQSSSMFSARQGFPSSILRITFKTHTFLAVDNFFKVMESLHKQQEDEVLGYGTDGFIFTPSNVPYSTKLASKEGRVYNLYKWKDASKTTIDFRIRRLDGDIRLTLVEMVDKKGVSMGRGMTKEKKETEFTGTARYPFDYKTGVDVDTLAEIPDGTTVEMAFDKKTQKFKFVNRRDEKVNTNSYMTAKSNWDNINSPLKIEELTGNGLLLAFRYHSRIKRELIGNSVGILLDLGAGRGGALSAQSSFSTIICVEKNSENIKELVKRATAAGREVVMEEDIRPAKYSVVIVNCGIQETDRITDVVMKCTNNRGADCVCLFDVGTFLWEPGQQLLPKCLDTIGRCLRDTGVFLWKMMDGREVKKLMKSRGGNRLDISTFSLVYEGEGEIDTHSQVTVTIPGSIFEVHEEYGGQVEYITDPSMMYKYMEKFGIEKESDDIASSEMLMGKDARDFSNLYSYGKMKKGGAQPQTATLEAGKRIITRDSFKRVIKDTAMTAPPLTPPAGRGTPNRRGTRGVGLRRN